MRAGRRWALVAGTLLVLVGAAAVVIYAGLYNIAADVPHTQPVYWASASIKSLKKNGNEEQHRVSTVDDPGDTRIQTSGCQRQYLDSNQRA
jgi:hypothetical protein